MTTRKRVEALERERRAARRSSAEASAVESWLAREAARPSPHPRLEEWQAVVKRLRHNALRELSDEELDSAIALYGLVRAEGDPLAGTPQRIEEGAILDRRKPAHGWSRRQLAEMTSEQRSALIDYYEATRGQGGPLAGGG